MRVLGFITTRKQARVLLRLRPTADFFYLSSVPRFSILVVSTDVLALVVGCLFVLTSLTISYAGVGILRRLVGPPTCKRTVVSPQLPVFPRPALAAAV